MFEKKISKEKSRNDKQNNYNVWLEAICVRCESMFMSLIESKAIKLATKQEEISQFFFKLYFQLVGLMVGEAINNIKK